MGGPPSIVTYGCSVDHQHGAPRMMQEVLADRAEEGSSDRAPAA